MDEHWTNILCSNGLKKKKKQYFKLKAKKKNYKISQNCLFRLWPVVRTNLLFVHVWYAVWRRQRPIRRDANLISKWTGIKCTDAIQKIESHTHTFVEWQKCHWKYNTPIQHDLLFVGRKWYINWPLRLFGGMRWAYENHLSKYRLKCWFYSKYKQKFSSFRHGISGSLVKTLRSIF